MMVGMSHLADDYGLDVWIWYPAMDTSYATEEEIKAGWRSGTTSSRSCRASMRSSCRAAIRATRRRSN